MAVGCNIIKNFKRPAQELVQKFKDISVANIDDAMGRIAAVDATIKPIGHKGQLLGTAFTIRVPQGDNLFFHAAMDIAKPGDVIVIDAGGYEDRAIFGELMSMYCRSRGIAGIVCDGAIRDCEAIAEMENFIVYAKAVSPNGPYKNGPGEINVPVVIGGKIVNPGDIVVGDKDGILFISPDEAEQLVDDVVAIKIKENEIMDAIISDGTYIRPWVDKLIRDIT